LKELGDIVAQTPAGLPQRVVFGETESRISAPVFGNLGQVQAGIDAVIPLGGKQDESAGR